MDKLMFFLLDLCSEAENDYCDFEDWKGCLWSFCCLKTEKIAA